jgi:putative toxin-antitoxin system antitoxin component (TIGR02293 family)
MSLEDHMSNTAQYMGNWLGQPIRSEFDVTKIVHRGLPNGVSKIFVARGMTADEFYSIVIPARTLKHRKAKAMRLSLDESDKAARAARVLAFAEEAFGDLKKALSWMRKPKKRFEGQTPMEMLRTEAGARLVEEELIQIDEGMFA